MACPTKLVRDLKRGMSGGDVLGIKYGLKATPYHKGILMTRGFGWAMYYNVRRFQKAHGLKVDGQVGPRTYLALRPHIPPYGCWLLNHYHLPTVPKVFVAVQTALYAESHKSSIHYTQGPLRWQGIDQQLKPPAFPHYADCSSFVTWCYWVAGLPDPNGLNYRAGYTGTLANHGRQVNTPLPGDLVLYGPPAPYHHVAIYIGNGQVVTHGSEAGPYIASIHYRGDLAQIRRYV